MQLTALTKCLTLAILNVVRNFPIPIHAWNQTKAFSGGEGVMLQASDIAHA